MRTCDMYLNLKKYEVSEEMINGAKAMANWYKMNGDEFKGEQIDKMLLQVEDDTRLAIGQVWGKLNAYKNRFAKLVAA